LGILSARSIQTEPVPREVFEENYPARGKLLDPTDAVLNRDISTRGLDDEISATLDAILLKIVDVME